MKRSQSTSQRMVQALCPAWLFTTHFLAGESLPSVLVVATLEDLLNAFVRHHLGIQTPVEPYLQILKVSVLFAQTARLLSFRRPFDEPLNFCQSANFRMSSFWLFPIWKCSLRRIWIDWTCHFSFSGVWKSLSRIEFFFFCFFFQWLTASAISCLRLLSPRICTRTPIIFRLRRCPCRTTLGFPDLPEQRSLKVIATRFHFRSMIRSLWLSIDQMFETKGKLIRLLLAPMSAFYVRFTERPHN